MNIPFRYMSFKVLEVQKSCLSGFAAAKVQNLLDRSSFFVFYVVKVELECLDGSENSISR